MSVIGASENVSFLPNGLKFSISMLLINLAPFCVLEGLVGMLVVALKPCCGELP